MAGINKVILVGKLGRDPEMHFMQNGTAVVSISMATSDQWIDKNTNQKQERTEWHRIVAFGRPAEILEKYLSKGDSLYVEGRLQTRSWEKEGQTHYVTEIVVREFEFLGSRSGSRQNQPLNGNGHNNSARGGHNTDDNYAQPQPASDAMGSYSGVIPESDDIPF